MYRSKLKVFCCLILVAALITGVSGCVKSSSAPSGSAVAPSGATLKELAKTEVTEYQGKNLSSITDFEHEAVNGTPQIDLNTYTLKIDGLVEYPIDLTYDDVLSYTKYTKEVTLNCVTGWSVDVLWEGILLKDLFDVVKVKPGANTIIFYGADGYTTSLPLQTILDKNIMIAYKVNGIVLPPELGFPFQLVAEDKLGYKWEKWVSHIGVSDSINFKGYWENQGYSNDASVT